MSAETRNLYKIARRLRAKPAKQVKLIHLLINLKSQYMPHRPPYGAFTKILLNRAYEWEYGRKGQLLELYDKVAYEQPSFRVFTNGNRTFERDGKFFSYNPDANILPF